MEFGCINPEPSKTGNYINEISSEIINRTVESLSEISLFPNIDEKSNKNIKISTSGAESAHLEKRDFLNKIISIKIPLGGKRTSLFDIVGIDWIHNCTSDNNSDYNKIIQLAEQIKEKQNAKVSEYNAEEIKWLLGNVSKSKYYNAEEFLLAYDYFKKKKTPDGEKILEGEDEIDDEKIMEYMLNINPYSIESSNMDMLLSLVERGIVDKHVFKYLPSKGKISPEIESDIDKLYQAYDMGISPIDVFIPSFKSIDEAITGKSDLMNLRGTYLEIKEGDVFQVEGEDFIRIKTSDIESEKLNISKETYFKLFPPIERYASTQNEIGNCWELTGINSLLCEADTRASVLRLFREDKNDIIIKFPNSAYEEIRFKDGEFPPEALKEYYSEGAMGVKMLEYADGIEIQRELIDKAYNLFDMHIKNAKDDREKQNWQQKLVKFTEFLETHSENADLSIMKYDLSSYKEYDGEYDSIYTENREGGFSSQLYNRLGYKNEQVIFVRYDGYEHPQNLQKITNILKYAKSFDDYIISWSSLDSEIAEEVENELGIMSSHSYRIKPSKVSEDGTVKTFKLINPWGITETELTIKEILKYTGTLSVVHKY